MARLGGHKRYQGEREAEFGEREGLTVALMTNTF